MSNKSKNSVLESLLKADIVTTARGQDSPTGRIRKFLPPFRDIGKITSWNPRNYPVPKIEPLTHSVKTQSLFASSGIINVDYVRIELALLERLGIDPTFLRADLSTIGTLGLLPDNCNVWSEAAVMADVLLEQKVEPAALWSYILPFTLPFLPVPLFKGRKRYVTKDTRCMRRTYMSARVVSRVGSASGSPNRSTRRWHLYRGWDRSIGTRKQTKSGYSSLRLS